MKEWLQTNLDDLLIRHTRQENMLFVLIRMELHHVGYLPVAELFDTLSGLRVPELHLPIIPTREELFTVIGEGDILDGFDVPMEGTQAVAVGVDIPELVTK
jgi:hypothetical protein